MIHQLFPTTIYSAQLESDDDTWRAMFAYVEQFRLKTQQSETMDSNLYLRNPNTLNVNKLPVPLKKANSSNDTHHQIIPKNDLLIIFPAYLPHYVSVYNGDEYRYSISYDLSVTARPDTDKKRTPGLASQPVGRAG